jgi:hypothetical protein
MEHSAAGRLSAMAYSFRQLPWASSDIPSPFVSFSQRAVFEPLFCVSARKRNRDFLQIKAQKITIFEERIIEKIRSFSCRFLSINRFCACSAIMLIERK